MLFSEVNDKAKYSINIYRTAERNRLSFNNIVNLFHPNTIDYCFQHDGAGNVPGIRDEEDNWELLGHKSRIVNINKKRLSLFANLYDEPQTPFMQARLPLIHSVEVIQVLKKFSGQPNRLDSFSSHYFSTQHWNETTAQKDGTIQREVCYPKQINEWTVSGPHFFIATPFNKNPNENCRHNQDYSDIDLTTLSSDFLPRTLYLPACGQSEYQKRIPQWDATPVTNYYRQVFRAMLGPDNERTLIGCIIPPGASHINGVRSFAFDDHKLLVAFSSLSNSTLYDYFIRSTGKQNLHELPNLLPFPSLEENEIVYRLLFSRTLRLNCLTTHYAALWEELYQPAFNRDGWAKADPRLSPWANLTPHWQRHVALRTPFERRQALVEIDVLAALALNLTLAELLTIYRVQFPVLQKNERRLLFDQRGMEVPVKTSGGVLAPDETHERFGEMVAPFTPVDREADYRQAWAYFEGKIGKE